MRSYRVGYFVGSLSSTSINRVLSRALIRLAPPDVQLTEVPIGDLPLYSPDFDQDYPPQARALKEAIAASDAVLFVTPEYNRSIPGALKNAIDWASRPWGQNSFDHVPAAVIGASPGQIGTAMAQQSLRAVLSFCNARQMTAPEVCVLQARPFHRRWRGHRRVDDHVPDGLHAGVPGPCRASPHRPPARLTSAAAIPRRSSASAGTRDACSIRRRWRESGSVMGSCCCCVCHLVRCRRRGPAMRPGPGR